MECTEARDGFRGWTLGAAMPERARAHLDSCPDCRAAWRGEQDLAVALADLRARTAGASASLAVKATVLDALTAAPPRAGLAWRPRLALAATLLVAIAAGWYFSRPAQPERQARQAGGPVYTDFFPLSAVALGRHEPAQVIRIRLPRGEMRRFGLPVSEELERLSIEADVLIGQDGVARAVRFVSHSH